MKRVSEPFAGESSGREVVNLSNLEANLGAGALAGAGAGAGRETATPVASSVIVRDGSGVVDGPQTDADAQAAEAEKFLASYDDWGANTALPFNVQRAFRFKFMVLLQLQLFTTLAIASALTYFDPLKGDLWSSLWFVWFFIVVITWTYLMKFADKHPYNYILLVVFTIALGWFFGACWDLFYSRGHIQMLVYTNCAFLSTMILSQIKVGHELLMEVSRAATISYFATIIGLLCVQGTHKYSKWEDVMKAIFMFSMYFLACAWESCKMTSGMNPDKYMLAVVYVYADLWMVIVMGCICAVCGWLVAS